MKYYCDECKKHHFETSKIGRSHSFSIIDAEAVEIAADGSIVPAGSRRRGEVRPPRHTFYAAVAS